MSLARASRLAAALAASCGPLHAGAAPTPLLRQGQQLVSLAAAWGAAPARGFAASDAAGAAAASAAPPPPAAAAAARSTTAAAAPASSSPAAAAAAAAAADPLQQQLPDVYVRLDGQHVERRYTVQPKPVFAVVEVGGTQYKVTPNDVIVVEKLSGVDVNDTLRLQRVLLLGSAEETVIGRPYVPEASVTAAVEEQFLDGKVLIFHKRRRKNSRRLRGHRQPLTTLRILDVLGIEEGEAAAAAPPLAAAAGQ